MTYQPMDAEQIAAALNSNADLTEAHFYDMIEESLNESAESRQWPYYPVDFVAGIEEWGLFRSALMRWLAEQDAEHFEGHRVSLAEDAEARAERPLRPVR